MNELSCYPKIHWKHCMIIEQRSAIIKYVQTYNLQTFQVTGTCREICRIEHTSVVRNWIVLNATFNNMSGISWGSQIQSPLKEQLNNNNKTVVKNKRPHINILYTNLAIKGCDLLHSVLVLGIWIFFRSLDYAIQLYILFLECPVYVFIMY